MTQVLLIHAGPTPWDEENRLVGSRSLPLTADAAAAVRSLVDNLSTTVTAICLDRNNEACEAVAGLLAEKFDVKPKDFAELAEWRLGLWEGLTREEVRRRFPTVIAEWVDRPQLIQPPGGEAFPEVIDRMTPALRKILKKRRGGVIALVLRPYAMQIARGLLQREPLEDIAKHLQNVDVMETIELSDEQVDALIE
jgi:broad specificity phosphatase PhoE